jgi:hypothetical protein
MLAATEENFFSFCLWFVTNRFEVCFLVATIAKGLRVTSAATAPQVNAVWF